MIEEIKKRLEAGEVVELECVNVYGFINNNRGRVREKEEILSIGLIVHSIDGSRGVLLYSNYFLRESGLEYFRIKEEAKNTTDITSHTHKGVTSGSEEAAPESKPTFDDLIDVAVKAYKDGVCDSVEIDINNWLIVKSSTGNIHCHKNHLIHDNEFHINWIKSLYTETFVIESEEDINKIKWVVAEAKLSNGKDIPLDVLDGSLDPYYTFCLLKGATVTQKRGK